MLPATFGLDRLFAWVVHKFSLIEGVRGTPHLAGSSPFCRVIRWQSPKFTAFFEM